MVDTKSLQETTDNWEGAINRVPGAYKKGVQGASNVIQKSIEGQGLYEEQMRNPEVLARRAKGLSKISDEDWRQAASTLGATRIGPGMDAAKPKYSSGMADVLSTIQGVQIAPRTADVNANIDNRVKPIANALRNMKGR